MLLGGLMKKRKKTGGSNLYVKHRRRTKTKKLRLTLTGYLGCSIKKLGFKDENILGNRECEVVIFRRKMEGYGIDRRVRIIIEEI